MTYRLRLTCIACALATASPATGASAAIGNSGGEVALAEHDGKYHVTADVYSAQIDAQGSLQSLVIGGTEFLCPRTEYTWRGETVVWPGTACGMSQGGGWPLRLYGPAEVERSGKSSIVARGDGWSLTYTFEPDTVAFRFQGFLPTTHPKYSSLCLSLADTIQRACEPNKHGEIPWPDPQGGYDGNIALLDAQGRGLIAERSTIGKRVRPEWPKLLTFFGIQGHKRKPSDVTHRIRLFTQPDLGLSVRMFVTSPNPDHFFPGALSTTFPVRAEILYGKSLTGKLRFEGQPYVWKKPAIHAATDLSLSPEKPEQTVKLDVRVPKPGHYTGSIQIADGDTVVARKIMGFVASPEKIPPAPVPDDFDAFWDKTLAELAKTPLDMELKEFPDKETTGGRLYKVKYRSWGGRWAWAWLNVPKVETKVPGSVICPAVGIYQPGTARPAGRQLSVRVAVHGGDVEKRKPEPDFDYMNTGITSRETFMLRYSYCCLARCYDILRNHPLCNGTIRASGGSQGGGLSLVLAGLRPVKSVSAASIALCRIDWTILGHTRWGPRLPEGEDPERIASIVSYYDPARFMHRVDPACTVRLLFGLFDFCAPAEGLFSALNGLPLSVRCEVYADPYGGHHTSTGEARKRFYGNEPAIVIPRWRGSARDNKLVK